MGKAQASIEYLLILSVVIVFVLIIMGVAGVFQKSTATVQKQQSDTYWMGADIGILPNHLVNSSGAYLTVKNNRPFRVRILSISFIDENGAHGSLEQPFILAPGGTANVDLKDVACAPPGSEYVYTVQIRYSEPTSGRVFTFTGEVPLVGTCQ